MNAPSLLATGIPACCGDETWKPIHGWPHHEASTCGRVRTVHWADANGCLHLGTLLPQHPDKRPGKGYLYVMLRDGRRKRRASVASVVLEAHRGVRPGRDYEACHGPAGRTDNHLRNLRWDTKAANLAEMWEARRAAADPDPCLETPETCLRAGFPRDSRSAVSVSARVQGNGSLGTGSFRSHSLFPSIPPPLNPSNLTLRTLFRSLRDRLVA